MLHHTRFITGDRYQFSRKQLTTLVNIGCLNIRYQVQAKEVAIAKYQRLDHKNRVNLDLVAAKANSD